MGQAIIGALSDWPGLTLAGAVERAGHASCGRPAGPGHPETLTICSNIGAIAHKCDVLIDFSVPAALAVTCRTLSSARPLTGGRAWCGAACRTRMCWTI